MDEDIQVPPIVKALAEKEGKVPWSWFVNDDHVTIVYQDGHKVRYERETIHNPKPAVAPRDLAHPIQPAPAPKKNQGAVTRTRSRSKK